MNTTRLGELILFHRKQAGLSREACALLAGVGKTAVFDPQRHQHFCSGALHLHHHIWHLLLLTFRGSAAGPCV